MRRDLRAAFGRPLFTLVIKEKTVILGWTYNIGLEYHNTIFRLPGAGSFVGEVLLGP